MAEKVTLATPIWLSDIEDQESAARGAAQIQNEYLMRLQYQGAPPDLVAKMAVIRDRFAEAMDLLEEVKLCFPIEP